jgi:hypothetical protein
MWDIPPVQVSLVVARCDQPNTHIIQMQLLQAFEAPKSGCRMKDAEAQMKIPD